MERRNPPPRRRRGSPATRPARRPVSPREAATPPCRGPARRTRRTDARRARFPRPGGRRTRGFASRLYPPSAPAAPPPDARRWSASATRLSSRLRRSSNARRVCVLIAPCQLSYRTQSILLARHENLLQVAAEPHGAGRRRAPRGDYSRRTRHGLGLRKAQTRDLKIPARFGAKSEKSRTQSRIVKFETVGSRFILPHRRRIACHQRGHVTRAFRFVVACDDSVDAASVRVCARTASLAPPKPPPVSPPCHGRETPVSTDAACSRRAARGAPSVHRSRELRLFRRPVGCPSRSSRPGVECSFDAVDVAPEGSVEHASAWRRRAVARIP